MISPWLFGRRADLLLFGGSTALALLFLGIGHSTGLLDGDAPPWLFLVAVVGVDVAHVWATGWRVLADGTAARARLALYLGVPLAAWAAGVAAYSVSALFFWRVLAYLAVFHFVRQQYGWVALYRRKNGEGGDGRLLDAAAIYGATLTPLLFWHAHLPRRFQWFLRGDFVNGLPEGVSTAAFVLYAGIFAAWIVKEVARARAGRPVSWGKVLDRSLDGGDVVSGHRRLRLRLRVHGDERLRPRHSVHGPRVVHVAVARRGTPRRGRRSGSRGPDGAEARPLPRAASPRRVRRGMGLGPPRVARPCRALSRGPRSSPARSCWR